MIEQAKTPKGIKIIAWLMFMCGLGTIALQLYFSRVRTVLPGEPGHSLPGEPFPPVPIEAYLALALIFITPLLFIISLYLMNRGIKTLLGVKIIVSLVLIGQLYILIPSLQYLLGGLPTKEVYYQGAVSPVPNDSGFYHWGLSFVEAIFITPLTLIAGIGLWRMKEWGLFAALASFSVKFSIFIGIQLPYDIFAYNIFAKSGSGVDYYIYLASFIIISIVYLLRKRRCFS